MTDGGLADCGLADALVSAVARVAGCMPTIPPDMVLVVVPLHDASAACRRAAEAHGAGLAVCHVGYDATRVLIGPIVAPGGVPCQQCARLWAPDLGVSHRAPPLPAPLIDLVAAQIVSHVAAWRAHGGAGQSATLCWIDVETLARSTHDLVPHPACARCCPDRPSAVPILATALRVSSTTWREQARPGGAALARLADPRVGLVRRFERETEAIVHPMTFAAFVGRGDSRQLEIGVGRTGCQRGDRDVAILEALERFSCFRPRGIAATVTARYRDVDHVAIDPRAFILPTPEQRDEPGFGLALFDPDTVYEWTWAFSFRRRSQVLIPLQIAYYDLPRTLGAPEQRFVLETSNGCALGSSVEEAALFGLFEVLERDAYLTTWYGRLVPGRLNVERTEDTYVAGMIARIEAAGFEVAVLDIGVGLPVAAIAVLAIDRRAGAPVASHLSTGAHLNAHEALRAALVEVCTRIQHRPPSVVAGSRARAAAMLRDPGRVRTMDDHAALYAHADSLPRLRFLTAAVQTDDFDHRFPRLDDRATETVDLGEALVTLVDAALEVADDVLVADLSNTLTASVGLHCVKVLAPGLLPVTFGHQYRRVSAERIAKVDPARAIAMADGEEGGARCWPHNFQ